MWELKWPRTICSVIVMENCLTMQRKSHIMSDSWWFFLSDGEMVWRSAAQRECRKWQHRKYVFGKSWSSIGFLTQWNGFTRQTTVWPNSIRSEPAYLLGLLSAALKERIQSPSPNPVKMRFHLFAFWPAGTKSWIVSSQLEGSFQK